MSCSITKHTKKEEQNMTSVWLPIYLCIKSNDCKWEIRDSPAKKQRCEGCASPPPPPSPSPSPSPLCSSAEEKEDPRSKIVFYNYDDDSDVEDDSDGMHEFTDKEFQEYDRQLTQSDGFDVMYFPRSFGFGGTEPVFNLDEIADDLKTFSELALKQYNDKEVAIRDFENRDSGIPRKKHVRIAFLWREKRDSVQDEIVGLDQNLPHDNVPHLTNWLHPRLSFDCSNGCSLFLELGHLCPHFGHYDHHWLWPPLWLLYLPPFYFRFLSPVIPEYSINQRLVEHPLVHFDPFKILIPIVQAQVLLLIHQDVLMKRFLVFGALGGLREESYGTGARGILVNLLEFTCLVAYHHIPQLMSWWPIILTSCNGHSKNHEFIYKYNLPFHSFGIEIISASLLCTKFFSPREYRTTLVCQTRKLKCCFCEILNCCIMGDGYLFKLVRIAVRGKFRLKHIVSTTKLDHHLLDFEFP
ncbi:hypothetical protein TEA_017993 [Camellia sinensis var. sinensis]|uniref:Uncharacterized protein n=1 Tax=Camellia sinensis var. sinensis TaxID=542762 RepID=A0A4S4ELS4_CAMSN|nr:hypothetical protein TEA_017993 [Camellia sinensis var. sinensis]